MFQVFSIQFHLQRASLVDRCSVFATFIFRPLSVSTFCHDSSLFWVYVLVMSIIARSSAYSSSHGSSVRTPCNIVSTSMMNRNGLSAEPWWRAIPTSKCSLVPRLHGSGSALVDILQWSYIHPWHIPFPHACQ